MSSSLLSIVDQLNALLLYLNLPITLQSPTDLTPSLILALLESILQQRLPGISTDIRTCRSEESRVVCVKMVLGILQTDIIAGATEKQQNHLDLDLTGVNPERLAKGGEEEVVKIARVLCWLGTKSQFQPIGYHSKHIQSPLSSTFSPSTKKRAETEKHNTSIQDLSINDILPHLSSFEEPPPQATSQRRPRCIHKVPSPDLEQGSLKALDSRDSSSSSLSFPMTPVSLPPVRQHGFIEDADEEEELESFERSRTEKSERSHVRQYDDLVDLDIDLEEAGHARTIALLKERARLSYRLAKLQQNS
ncbi:hypothetical protein L218DRAFT_953219 [Marasmius fiardii PR-910]|nr:hypothetical protein L218DRAFT_953219 [Marasmius fiardii PR-910]